MGTLRVMANHELRPTPERANPGAGAARARTALFVALCLLASARTLYLFVTWPGMNLYPRARFGATIYGRCERPFVQRVLVPWTVRALTVVMPEGARGKAAGIVRGLVGSDPRLAYAATTRSSLASPLFCSSAAWLDSPLPCDASHA